MYTSVFRVIAMYQECYEKSPNSLPHFLVSADDAPVLRYE